MKDEVAEVVIEALRPIRKRYVELISDPGELDRILASGAERVSLAASPKIEEIKLKRWFFTGLMLYNSQL